MFRTLIDWFKIERKPRVGDSIAVYTQNKKTGQCENYIWIMEYNPTGVPFWICLPKSRYDTAKRMSLLNREDEPKKIQKSFNRLYKVN